MMSGTSIKTARPIGVQALGEKEFAEKYASRVRKGKTAKDHASGSWANRLKNQAARASADKEMPKGKGK